MITLVDVSSDANSVDPDQTISTEQSDLDLHCLSKRLLNIITDDKRDLSYDVASGSEITPCNKIDKPLVVYRLMGNVLTSITTLGT